MSDAEFEAIERKKDAADARMASGERVAIRKAYLKDYKKFGSAYDHDMSEYKKDLLAEIKEDEKFDKTPEGKAKLKKEFEENRARVAEAKKRKARLKTAGSLFRAVSKGVGVIGLAAVIKEMAETHKELKSKPKHRYGSQSLFKDK